MIIGLVDPEIVFFHVTERHSQRFMVGKDLPIQAKSRLLPSHRE